jgi:hypothetical protein
VERSGASQNKLAADLRRNDADLPKLSSFLEALLKTRVGLMSTGCFLVSAAFGFSRI